MDNEIMSWWIRKYKPQIVNYINMVVQFEELSPEALEFKRKDLLLEYIDSSDSTLIPYLMNKIDDFLDRVYDAIYESISNGRAIEHDA